jgi:tryptophanase
MKREPLKAEPYRIKMVEPLSIPSREHREKRLKEGHYNLFRLQRSDIYIDLLTDSGTSAMSDNQWAGIMLGDESYAGGRAYEHLAESVQKVMGFAHFIPTHQGRPAESLLFQALVKEGSIVPFNMPFDSTEANVMANGGEPVSCVIDEAYDPELEHPFKGNVDLEKLKAVIAAHGSEKIPLIMTTITNNTGGGQPVSMQNLREVKKLAEKHGIPVFLDAARCVENAYFIQQREKGYETKSIAKIVLEEFSYSDGCTFSCKKDALVNMGGLICMRDKSLYDKIVPLLILLEGFITYGGLSGRDEEALARGLREMVDDDHIAARVQQVEYLGERVREYGISAVRPTGGHAVFIDAAAFLPHIPKSQFPAEVLGAQLYLETGVRGVGLGSLAFAKENPKTGEVEYPKLELFRLTIPRRVYTYRHMDVVAEGLKQVYAQKDDLRGLKITHAPKVLRHFLAELEPV